MTDCVVVCTWLCGCVAVWLCDCVSAEAAAQPNRGGGRGQVGRTLCTIAYYILSRTGA